MNSTGFVIEYLFCLIISWHVSEKYQEYFQWLLIYLIKCLSFLCISLFPWTTIYFKISSKIKKKWTGGCCSLLLFISQVRWATPGKFQVWRTFASTCFFSVQRSTPVKTSTTSTCPSTAAAAMPTPRATTPTIILTWRLMRSREPWIGGTS